MRKQYITFTCQHQKIERTDSFFVVGGSHKYLFAQFKFCEDWDGEQQYAVFTGGGRTLPPVKIVDGECEVPWEMLLTKRFFVGCEAGDRITSNAAEVVVHPCGAPEATDTPRKPTPTLQNQIGNLDELKTEAKGNLVEAVNEVFAKGGNGAGQPGADGGYYTPSVTQPDSNTMKVEYTASKADMPPVAGVEITLPTGVGAGGLTEAQIEALDGMFKVVAYSKADVSAEYAAFKEAFGIIEDEPEVTLTSISATYSGGGVASGTDVADLTGIVVTAHYSDGSTATVTGYTLSGTIAEGENTVTVSYGGKTTTFTVIGVASEEIAPDVEWDYKWDYTQGLPDANGMTLTTSGNPTITLTDAGVDIVIASTSGYACYAPATTTMPSGACEFTVIPYTLSQTSGVRCDLSNGAHGGIRTNMISHDTSATYPTNSMLRLCYDKTGTQGFADLLAKLTAGEEYTVRMVFDQVNKKHYIYLNGILVGERTTHITDNINTNRFFALQQAGHVLFKSIKYKFVL